MPENPIPPLNLADPFETQPLVLPDPPVASPPLPPTPITPTVESPVATVARLPEPNSDPVMPPLTTESVSAIEPPVVAVHKFPFLLTIILIFLSVAAAIGIYLLVQVRTMALDKVTPSPTPIPTPTATPDPTEGWQSYHNSKYLYSLKVPNFLTHLNRGPSNQKKIDDNDWYFAKTDTSELDSLHKTIASSGAVFLEIAIYKDAAKQNYDLHCKGKPLSFNQKDPIISTESVVGEVDEFIQSSGIAAHSTVPKAEYWDSKVCFMKDGIDYEIYYQNYESSEADPALYQILSTFQFDEVAPIQENGYVCPKTEWVDCMPSGDAGVKLECTPEFLSWARSSCAGFKGGAL